jgi:hypothetical protein
METVEARRWKVGMVNISKFTLSYLIVTAIL